MQLCWRCFTSEGFSLVAYSLATGAYLPDTISSKFNSIPSQIISQLTHPYLKSCQTAFPTSRNPPPSSSNAQTSPTPPSSLVSGRSPSGHRSAVASLSASLWISQASRAISCMIPWRNIPASIRIAAFESPKCYDPFLSPAQSPLSLLSDAYEFAHLAADALKLR